MKTRGIPSSLGRAGTSRPATDAGGAPRPATAPAPGQASLRSKDAAPFEDAATFEDAARANGRVQAPNGAPPFAVSPPTPPPPPAPSALAKAGPLLPQRWLTDTTLDALAREALLRKASGQTLLPYVLENATGGLGTRTSGRGFGVELEFDVAPVRGRHGAALKAFAQALYAVGLGAAPRQTSAHRHGTLDFHTRGWKFERDPSVCGEVVSPLMFDERETWESLETVLELLRRHGAQVGTNVGGHVHVGAADFGPDVRPHQALVDFLHRYQPELYALATHPERGAHRMETDATYCAPNKVYDLPCPSLKEFRFRHGTQSTALSFKDATGDEASHVEFRLWDGSLDESIIQTQITVSLAMAAWAAAAEPLSGPDRDAPSSHATPDPTQLERMLAELFPRQEDRVQAATLFAVVREARRSRLRPSSPLQAPPKGRTP